MPRADHCITRLVGNIGITLSHDLKHESEMRKARTEANLYNILSSASHNVSRNIGGPKTVESSCE